MKKQKGEWIEFEVYPETSIKVTAKALIVDGVCEKVKLKTSVGRVWYYSFLNDAGLEAERRWPIKQVTA